MTTDRFTVGSLTCTCCSSEGATRAAYILYPMDIPGGWIEEASSRHSVTIAVITGMDWDNALSPWPAPGVPRGCPPFGGDAAEFLKQLTGNVIPAIDKRLGTGQDVERTLVGVSMSGLFTMWQWALSDFFLNIATLSGSFWYERFATWACTQTFAGKRGLCYMLLGADEPRSAVPQFRTVADATGEICRHLRDEHVNVRYDTVPGNHYQHPIARLDRAFAALYPLG